ncbi:MAG: hypothetical protein ACRDSZ_15285 [Pseudonocardiaceae bacterium]
MSTTAEQSTAPADSAPPQGTQPLTALTPIIPGRRAQLQQVLAMVRERIASGGPSPLEVIGTVHFARWVVLPDDQDGGQLLFTSNFDGPWDDYIEDFAAQAAESFDAIYSNCVGWPERGSRDVDAFKAYVRAHETPTDVYYRAYPMATVRQVKAALKLKDALNNVLAVLNE